ncbi:hypothetical protein BWQ96_04660 [Gracilariopsis chorda]|uniref:Uncharacterized protein n=1 Tax=Gracilariopsis chorda TaxID=448386 RepID=A0A2V3IU04_9FLOR|nr:hypothetical protein BWQ96_04660 [Gracilariopsis chorda]|eukprot:PXF45583.1 hypothetical protein BWQ96_04660 [Gracilariopsis chorda]
MALRDVAFVINRKVDVLEERSMIILFMDPNAEMNDKQYKRVRNDFIRTLCMLCLLQMKKRLQAGGLMGMVEQEIVAANQDSSGPSTIDMKSGTAIGTANEGKEDVADSVLKDGTRLNILTAEERTALDALVSN